ncbi:50S ribosomal protein L25 [Candidatus Saccharibacteria bacterium]|nr:50S ribosomal protein L25 [Candidatus Saccharibacteria bacterium]
MSKSELNVDKREISGKKVARLRAQDLIPGVVYGGQSEPILVQSDYNTTEKALREVGYHSPISLMIAGKKQLAIVKNVDMDPVRRTIINVEFQAVSADEVITATTPIEIEGLGNTPAEQAKLNVLQVTHEIEVKAKPADLPEALVVSGEMLKDIESQITIGDIVLPAGVKFADPELDMEQVVANVYDAAAEAAQQEAEDAKAAEEAAVAGDGAAVEVPSDKGGAAEEKAE